MYHVTRVGVTFMQISLLEEGGLLERALEEMQNKEAKIVSNFCYCIVIISECRKKNMLLVLCGLENGASYFQER
jgi:hypothetical protein